jgi:hypothetical protein
MLMAMSPEEQKQFWEMQAQIKSLYNVIIGDPLNQLPGFAERLNGIEQGQKKMDASVKRLTWIAIGVGIGVLIGGAIFGFLSWKQVGDIIKFVK